MVKRSPDCASAFLANDATSLAGGSSDEFCQVGLGLACAFNFMGPFVLDAFWTTLVLRRRCAGLAAYGVGRAPGVSRPRVVVQLANCTMTLSSC
jgi:hypothetical protein